MVADQEPRHEAGASVDQPAGHALIRIDPVEARALAVFKACCDLVSPELEAALDDQCGDDLALKGRVLILLEADRRAEAEAAFASGTGRRILVDDLVESFAAGEEPDELPEALGPYRVIALLGAGGMGLVYEAEQARPKRRVAVKTVHPHLRTEAMLARFRHEVEVMGALTHPAIPQVYEAGEQDGTAWLAMELVRGQPLDEHLAKRPATERLERLIEVVDGVAQAHAAGVVHCDLKPANVLITVEGQPKILDFGLATSLAAATVANEVAGTIAYMAPEQRVSGATLDPRVDVFALGVIIREVLTPTRDLDAVVAKATAPDPTARYPTARELADDLRRLRAIRSVHAWRAPARHRLALWAKRHHRQLRLVAIALFVIALLGLGAAVRQEIERARNASEAQARLTTVERRVTELEAAGDHATADAVFHLYAGMHDHLGTRALHDAWVWRAERESKRSPQRAIEAWAEAVTTAIDATAERAALIRLADALAGAGDWRSLEHVLARLSSDDTAETTTLRYRTAVYHRELGAAARHAVDQATAPLVAALSVARPVDQPLDRVVPYRWQGRDLLIMCALDRAITRLVDPARDFTTVLERDEQLDSLRVVRGADGWVVRRVSDTESVLARFDGTDPISLPLGVVVSAVGWQAADGLHALLGGAATARDLNALVVRDHDATITRAPLAIRWPESDADQLLRADLDGDGAPEIALALGAWRAYDLRIFELDDTGTFTPRARKQVGVLAQLTLLPQPAGPPLLAAAKIDNFPSTTQLGAATPYGPEAGVYLFAYRAGHIEQVGFVPIPAGLGTIHGMPQLVAGDFDGDGLVDLAWTLQSVDAVSTLLLRQTSPRHLEPILVGGVTVLAAVQVDDDPASELLVSVDSAGTRTGWVLGAGVASIPTTPRGVPHAARDRAPVTGDQAFARVWNGARTLSDLGLLQRSAEHLEAAALLAGDDALEATVLTEAAERRLELGQPALAAALFERASALSPPTSAAAKLGAARSWLAAVEPARALAQLRDAVGGSNDASLLAEANAMMTWLVPLVEASRTKLILEWHGPLAPPLAIVAPESVARVDRGGLALRVFSDQEVIARVPLSYAGGRITLTVDHTLQHLEIGGGFRIALREVGAAVAVLGVEVSGSGGDQSVGRIATCLSLPVTKNVATDPRPIDAPDERIALQIDYWPPAGERAASLGCRLGIDLGEARPAQSFGTRDPIASGDYELLITGPDQARWGFAEARAILHRIEVTGLVVRDAPITELERAHRDYVNGDYEAARPVYNALPGAEPLALMDALDHASEAVISARMATLIGAFRGRDPTLMRLLRIHRARLTPLLWRLDPLSFGAIYHHAWGVALRYIDAPESRDALLDSTLDWLTGSSTDELALMNARAALLYDRGDDRRSRVIAERVLAAEPSDPERASLIAQAMLLAARLAHRRGDAAAAGDYVQRWRSQMPIQDLARERLVVDPENAALLPYL